VLEPEHISTYCLTYEEDTEFLARFESGEFSVTDEKEARFLELAMTALEQAGYEHYEISNYARPGFRSEHNRAYWCGADYIGMGPSAFSTRGLERWQNVADHAGRQASGGFGCGRTDLICGAGAAGLPRLFAHKSNRAVASLSLREILHRRE
jgi:oxygen-independent coproporphyrinogen-3 oxidase